MQVSGNGLCFTKNTNLNGVKVKWQSADGKSWIKDNTIEGSEEWWICVDDVTDYTLQDGTVNTVDTALQRLTDSQRSYLLNKYKLSDIFLTGFQAEDLFIDLCEMGIISENEMILGVNSRYNDPDAEPNVSHRMIECDMNIQDGLRYYAQKHRELAEKEIGLKEDYLKRADGFDQLNGILKGIFGEVKAFTGSGDIDIAYRNGPGSGTGTDWESVMKDAMIRRLKEEQDKFKDKIMDIVVKDEE